MGTVSSDRPVLPPTVTTIQGRAAAPIRTRLSHRHDRHFAIRSFSNYSSDSDTDDEDVPKKSSAKRTGNEMVTENGRIWTAKKVLVLAACTLSMILNISCQNSASVALPQIGREFNVTEAELQWIISGYSLSSGCLLIFVGRLADLHGRKLAFLFGVAWLMVFSIGCGFAKSIIALNILRALQGLSAAAFVPASIGILAHAFPVSRARSIAFTTFSAGAPIGGGLGMQLGGVLTQLSPYTWRSTFFLSAGLAALIFLLGYLVIDKDTVSEEKDRRVDWFGAGLVTASLTLIQFALGQGPIAPQRWSTTYIIVTIVVGFLLLAAFLWWQHHLERSSSEKSLSPLMKLSMWKRAKGKFAVVQCIVFLEFAAFTSWLFWSQLYYQNYAGFSPINTALRFLPMPITGVLVSILAAFLVDRIDMLFLVLCGTVMTAIAGLLFAVIKPSASYWAFGFPSATLAVFGPDFVLPSGLLFIAKVSLPHEQSLAAGLYQTLAQLGTALGLAATTIIHDAVLQSGSSSLPSEGSERQSGLALHAYKAAQWGVVVMAAMAAMLALTFLRGVGPVGDHKVVEKVPGTSGDGIQHVQRSRAESIHSVPQGKSSSVRETPSLKIARVTENQTAEEKSKETAVQEALYVVWKHADSKKRNGEDGGDKDSAYYFVA